MCSFWNVSFLGRALFGLYPLRNVLFLECAFFGMCTFWNVPFLECALFGMCPFWNVPFLECALFGMCHIWNVLFLECALFGMCSFWNVPFLEWTVFGMCPFWNALFLSVPFLAGLSTTLLYCFLESQYFSSFFHFHWLFWSPPVATLASRWSTFLSVNEIHKINTELLISKPSV